jgi:hypothetical protein
MPRLRIGVLSGGGVDEGITNVGANGTIGVGTPLVAERNLNLVGIQKPDASETTELVVATDPRPRNGRSRQAGCYAGMRACDSQHL